MIQRNFNYIVDGLREFLPFCDLRQSQLNVFEEFLLKSDENITKGFFDLATGFGKTRVMNVLTESFLSKNPNGKVLVVVPTITLIKDENGDGMIKRFQDFHQMYHHEPLSIGSFYTYEKDIKSNIIITTYSSLSTLADVINPKDVGLLLLDEAHHGLSQKRIETIKKFSNACCYGLTATPAYSPDKSLESLLGTVISEINIVQAVKDGILAPCKNILLSSKIKVDLSNVLKTNTGEYDPEELEYALSQALKTYQSNGNFQNWQNVHELIANEIAVFYQNYVDEIIGKVQGKKCIINCRTQTEAMLQARALNKLFGKTVAASWVTETKDKTILNKFVNGDLPVLCQVGKLTEGFDMPELDICINYPTCSKVLETQRGGRVMRLNPQNEKKIALIVDMVFSHPDFDNPILSSHANGQVLYRDIINTSMIHPDKDFCGEKRIVKIQERNENINNKLCLEAFDVFSCIEELITLENEASVQLAESNIPPKREGMKSSLDLEKVLGKTHTLYIGFLQKYYKEGKTFDVDGVSYPLVEKVRSRSHVAIVLHENPQALETFKRLLQKEGIEFDLPLKRDGMKSSLDLEKLLGRSNSLYADFLQKYYKEGKRFDVGGMSYPLVERVRSSNQVVIVLHENPQALETFKRLLQKEGIEFDLPFKREGMKTSLDLAKFFGKTRTLYIRFLQKYYKEGKTFDVDGASYPLVEKVRSGTNVVIVLHENPQALETFKRLLQKEGGILEKIYSYSAISVNASKNNR